MQLPLSETEKLNKEQLRVLRAVLDCLIPPDDFPGAWDAGVADYIDRQFNSDLAEQRDFYCLGLDYIDAESQARFQTSFNQLTAAQQTETLQEIEVGKVTTNWPVSPQSFFTLLVNTTAEGYYADPEQGGNRESKSWLMTGFETRVDS